MHFNFQADRKPVTFNNSDGTNGRNQGLQREEELMSLESESAGGLSEGGINSSSDEIHVSDDEEGKD